MLKFIESQLNVNVSTSYLDQHKHTGVPHDRQFRDLTNMALSGNASLSQSIHLGGNPLTLEEICDLTVIDSQLSTTRVAPLSRFFNYSQYKPLKPDELSKAFSTFGEGVLFLINGTINEQPQLVALLPGVSPETRRVLRIFTIINPDTNLTLDQLEAHFMPFSRNVSVSYEADYSLPFNCLHVNFTTPTAGLLSCPESITIAHLTTKVSPYSTALSPLVSIKTDLDRIKRLSLAYQNESMWTPLGEMRPEPLSAHDLERLVASRLDVGQQELFTPLGQRLVRQLVSTERMWEALKDAPDRKTAREGFLAGLKFLQENTNLFVVNMSDFTQFATLARSCMVSERRNRTGSFEVLGLRMLIEAGVLKATNDCLAIIKSVSPSLERGFVSENLTDGASLELRFRLLHHLYRVSCLVVGLATVAQFDFVENEIGPILFDMKNIDAEFTSFMKIEQLETNEVIVHTCSIPLKNLTAPLSNFTPDLWIMRLSAVKPMHIEKRLVYECVNPESGARIYYCHVLSLVDTVWFNGA